MWNNASFDKQFTHNIAHYKEQFEYFCFET